VQTFSELVGGLRTGSAGLAIAERGGEPVSLFYPSILIGPEGGWSDPEREAVIDTVTLSEQVLRTETAALTAGAFLAALRSGHLYPVHGPVGGY